MPVSTCKEDFEEIREYFCTTHNITIPFGTENIGSIKKLHRSSYGFLLLKSRLKIRNHANIFSSELQSDFLQIMPLVIKGYEKLALVLLRDILENTLKFIFYYNHPVEFIQLEEKTKSYISFEDLIKYSCEHPDIIAHSEGLYLLGRFKAKYSELSKYVHSKDINYMHLVKYLKQIKFKKEFLIKFMNEFTEVHSLVMTILILFHYQKFIKLSIPDRRFILNSILKKDKKYLIAL